MRVVGEELVWGRRRFPRGAWNRAVAEAEVSDFNWHDLRHSAPSYLAMSGARLRDIQAILGHQAIVTTTRYAHLTEDHLSDVAARAARWGE